MNTHAIRVHRFGGPEALTWESIDLPEPPAGSVRVRATAIGVNFIDTYHRTGVYPMTLPGVVGGESAGVVDAVGPGVTDLVVGDRVAAASGMGAYAEHRNVAADRLVKLPDGVSDEVAAAALLKGLTVEYLIRRTYPVKAGETVLVHAAAGGVGKLACQWLRHLGATVIGTVGSDAKVELAKGYGCSHVLVHTKENIVARVRELTGGAGVPVVYDSIGKDTLMTSLDCLSPRGLLVTYGNASGRPAPLDLGLLMLKGSLFVTRPTLGTYIAKREDLVASAAALFEVIVAGVVEAAPTARFALQDAADAHRRIESRASTGATILVP